MPKTTTLSQTKITAVFTPVESRRPQFLRDNGYPIDDCCDPTGVLTGGIFIGL